MEKEKVMILVATYYPLQDGVQAVTEYIAEGLARKCEVEVVTSLREDLSRVSQKNGVNIKRYNIKKSTYTMTFHGEKRQVLNRIKAFNPTILIAVCVQTWCFDWIKKNLNELPGEKILYTHGCSCLEGYSLRKSFQKFRFHKQILADILELYIDLYWTVYRKSMPRGMKKFDKVIYLNEKDPLFLFAQKRGLKNGHILENAVEDFFFQQKKFLKTKQDKVTFLNVSSYIERKNQKLILEAFYEANISNADMVFIGSKATDYYRGLIKLNEQLEKRTGNYGKVHFLCGISREDVIVRYEQADIYVAASNFEVMSISLCEAAAAGIPIISTNVGHAAMIPGVILYAEKNELVEKMRFLSLNVVERKERGRKEYKYALEHYNKEKKIVQLEELLQIL